MSNSELTLTAISKGEHDDKTISAALDALREDEGLSLIRAVLEVTRVHKAHQDAKEVAQAATMMRSGSPLRKALHRLIVTECPRAEEESACTVMLVEGDRWPYIIGFLYDASPRSARRQHIAVGAAWVVQRGENIRATLERTRQVTRRGKAK